MHVTFKFTQERLQRSEIGIVSMECLQTPLTLHTLRSSPRYIESIRWCHMDRQLRKNLCRENRLARSCTRTERGDIGELELANSMAEYSTDGT